MASIRPCRCHVRLSRTWHKRHVDDPYVRRALAEGYRSRAAFKLIELDDRVKSPKLLRKGTLALELQLKVADMPVQLLELSGEGCARFLVGAELFVQLPHDHLCLTALRCDLPLQDRARLVPDSQQLLQLCAHLTLAHEVSLERRDALRALSALALELLLKEGQRLITRRYDPLERLTRPDVAAEVSLELLQSFR